jgi:predicted esterase
MLKLSAACPIYCLMALCFGLLVGCINSPPAPTLVSLNAQNLKLLEQKQWQAQTIHTKTFDYWSANSPILDAQTVVVYLEGDGHAWLNSRTPSTDPTPYEPIALKLALQDPAPAVAYLGRACQYTNTAISRNCHSSAWLSHRYSQEVISSTNEALDQIKRKFNAKSLILIGYSGGATIAALGASQRQDVSQIITVAGNLDTAAWVLFHRLSPLSGSLNPADDSQKMSQFPQIHFMGEADDVVPPSLTKNYASKVGTSASIKLVNLPGYDHQCCWVDTWPALLQQYRPLH